MVDNAVIVGQNEKIRWSSIAVLGLGPKFQVNWATPRCTSGFRSTLRYMKKFRTRFSCQILLNDYDFWKFKIIKHNKKIYIR